MKKNKLYQVDAFAGEPFSGNPAAVCPLAEWLPEKLMQHIAMENNLSETAFYVKNDDHYDLRWFTPTVEVDLCGHATLATAFVLFNLEGHQEDIIKFRSHRSGPLSVKRQDELLTLNFPVDEMKEVIVDQDNYKGLNIKPLKALRGKTDLMLVYGSEKEIHNLAPDFTKLAEIDARGVIVTAPGDEVDFVSRFFGPNAGVNEDPVTGSAHTSLTPYWSTQFSKQVLTARQLSPRGGELTCKNLGDRVEISGKARLYLSGEIIID